MSVTLQQRILLKAADLLENPRRWTRGAEARDARGRSVDWGSAKAVRFCALGALSRISDEHGVSYSMVQSYIGKKRARGHQSVVGINDIDGRKAVIRYLRWLAQA